MIAFGNDAWADNWTRGDGLRVEIMAVATADVWLCQSPVEHDTVRGLAVPEGFRLSGLGTSVADEAYFARSPDAEADGPLDTMQVDGLRFCRVARPLRHESIGTATVVSVHKHHTMRYGAGRVIVVLDLGDGTVLTPAWSGRPGPQPGVPDGWRVDEVMLTADLVTRIPDPATVAVLADGSGFHGPVGRGLIDEAAG